MSTKRCIFFWKGENSKREQDEKDEYARHWFCAEADSDLEVCQTLRISQICSQKSATGFEHRVQNVLRVQSAVSWVSKFAVGAHFRGCV